MRPDEKSRSLLAALAILNFQLWMSMVYQITKIDNNHTDYDNYEGKAWAIFVPPLLLWTFVLYSPWPRALKDGRHKICNCKFTLLRR